MDETTRTRNPRHQLDCEIAVTVRTIGSDLSFPLSTRLVSKSGMLLNWVSSLHVPFLPNTIVSMTIDPNSAVLTNPLECLGKVVVRLPGASGPDFGISIIQIDARDLNEWEMCILQLAVIQSNQGSGRLN